MGLILLIQTSIICIFIGSLIKTFWFSYILFLIFVGGILVLFIYVTSLASNEIFNLSIRLLFIAFFIFLFMSIIFIVSDKNLIIILFESSDSVKLTFLKRFYLENSFSINKLYNFPINLVTIILIVYLFLTLIAIVKITNVFDGPLRPKTI